MFRTWIYYQLKPAVPVSTRMAIRRWFARRKRAHISRVWPILPGSERPPENWVGWPDGKKFAFVLTHDVEGPIGLARCRQLMELEKELGFRSSFNFIPQGDYRVSRDLRHELTRNGFEVGVHDLHHDGKLYQNSRGFADKARQINRYIREWDAQGFRSGFMFHRLEWLHQLEVAYDASTFDTDPFEPQPDGVGTIFPFWVPRTNADHRSPITNHPLSLPNVRDSSFELRHSAAGGDGYVELPYTLPQDSTLFLLLREQTPEIWFKKLAWIAEHGGMVLVNVHPDYTAFSNGSARMPREFPVELYKQFLEHVRSRYAGQYWHSVPREVAAHVRRSRKVHQELDSRNGQFERQLVSPSFNRLNGKHAAVLLFSYYPADPRPRRAAEALAQEGVTVDLLCLQQNRGESRRELINKVRVFRVPMQRHRRGRLRYVSQYSAFILRSFFFLTIRSLVRRYDFVHVHNMPDALVFSAAIPKALGAKIALDLHDPMPELMQAIFDLPAKSLNVRLVKRLERWSIGFADLVLTVNLACKKIYSSRSCRPDKIKVVINTPDDKVFRFQRGDAQGVNGKNGNGSGPFVILYHGSLVHRNGFDLAVESLEKVRKIIPSVRLKVCGQRTSFFEEVMKSAQQRGLDTYIEYLGVRNLPEIVKAIDSCDLGIIPNHRNVFTEINTPTRILEYLALGKPVIVPKTEGIHDYFGENDLIFFEVGDADDLARKIEFAYSHPVEVSETVKRGQEIYLSHTWSREKLTFLNSISELLETADC
ncbi:MAG: hypothetical protein DMF26_15245 [Verrucomicrobia bacterium]|nr:MAG: hypothetical protein DMF26_15245 [Verrucomicrobiota bacterium]